MYLDGCFLSVIVSLICFVKKVGSGVEKSSCKIENAMDLLLYEIATHNGLKLFLKENLYFLKFLLHFHELGLNRTGHMSFLTGQDRTPKFAGQVLPDWTESGHTFLTFYLTSMGYQFSF